MSPLIKSYTALFVVAAAVLSGCETQKSSSGSYTHSDEQQTPRLILQDGGSCQMVPKAKPFQVKRTFLYRISKSGVVSHLLGTIHIGISVEELSPQVRTIFDGARVHVAEWAWPLEELDLFFSNPVERFRKMATNNPSPEKLSVSEAEKTICFGVPSEISSLIANDDCNFVAAAPYLFYQPKSMDLQLLRYALQSQRPIVQLDTQYILNLTERLFEQDDCRVNRDLFALTPQQTFSSFEQFLNEYANGEEKDMLDDDAGVAFRNDTWRDKLQAEVGQGNAFIAVGVAHLFGEHGVITYLQSLGYEVTRL